MSLNDLYMPHGQHRTKKDARLITAFISVHVDVHFSAMLLWRKEREKKKEIPYLEGTVPYLEVPYVLRGTVLRGYLEDIDLMCGG